MFSINAARCACASETTDAVFQILSPFLLRDFQLFVVVDSARHSLDERGFMVKMGSFVR